MGKQYINIGLTANDQTADTIRDAFIKVNKNFTELYNELTDDGSTLSTLAFSGSSLISDATNGDIIIDPNGTGITKIESDLVIDSVIRSSNSSLIDIQDAVRISGSLTANTIQSEDSSAVTVNDGLIVTGNLAFDGGASVDTILDEDTMSSDSATALATQQSIKAYVDSQIGGANSLTLGDDASSEITLNLSDTLNVKGGNSLSSSVAGDSLTIALNDNITVNQIGALDSSSVMVTSPLQASSTMQIAGALSPNGGIGASSSEQITFTGIPRLPQISTATRDGLSAQNGMLIYNTDNSRIEAYENGSWIPLRADTADIG